MNFSLSPAEIITAIGMGTALSVTLFQAALYIGKLINRVDRHDDRLQGHDDRLEEHGTDIAELRYKRRADD